MANSNHFYALTRKNFILWKRSPCCSICEILLPTLLCCIMFVLRANIDRTNLPENSYLANNQIQKLEPEFPQYLMNTGNIKAFPPLKDCIHGKDRNYPSLRNGKIYMAPKNDITQQLEIYFQQYNYSSSFKNSKQELLDYMSSKDYNEDVCLGISIDQSSQSYYQYSLMYNTSGRETEIPQSLMPETLYYKKENNKNYFQPWIKSGFLTIQQWIDNIIIKKETGKQLKVASTIVSLKVPAYTKDEAGDYLKGNFAPYVVLPMILPFLRMCYGLLIEKEKKIREGMKIMGMKDSSFYLSWIFYYMIIYTFISILVSLVLQGSMFQETNLSVLFIWHWLFCWSLIFQAIFITSFFTQAKMGNIVSMVWFLFNYMVNFFLQDESVPYDTKAKASLLSHTGFTFSCDVFLLIETEGLGINWSNLNQVVNNFSIGTYMGMTIVNIAIFIILSFYADQVVPNEFGKKKHPLFFIMWMFKKKSDQEEKIKQDEENKIIKRQLEYQDNIEPVDHQLQQQILQNQTLDIYNLRKQYPTGKLAVQNLSINMYNGQIFVLLGHNGAGKTTTISMLTGMIEFTQGDAIAFGKNVKTEMEDIRQFMGVCPQHDILFDNLSVKEHLELFAVFKGMNKEDIPKAVEKAIQDVDLQEKINELSKNLSGGQKRRLSVAIAFIGGSKLIYLDEPTSGMDTSARRHIWEMLKKYKNDKVVVLTTHFMDEADFLGDRIGIMGEGKLICCGSSVFLKNKYGVGYNLTIVKKDTTTDSQPIINYIKNTIPEMNVLSNVSAEIGIQLPMSQIKEFSNLFLGIDEQLSTLGIQSYGISITTLEEVFLRVAELAKESNKAIEDQEMDEVNKQKMDEQNKQYDDIDNFDLNKIRVTASLPLFIIHFIALFTKRVNFFKRDTRGFVCEIFLPCIVVVAGLSILLIQFAFESPSEILTGALYKRPMDLIYSGNQANIQKSDMDNVINSLGSIDFTPEYYNTNQSLEWDQYNFIKRDQERKGAYFFNSKTALSYDYIAEINTISRNTAPYFINRMNTAILRYESHNNNADIQVTVNPMPLTYKFLQIINSADGVVAAFMFSIGLSFIPASLITFIVKERNDNVKHQQVVCGVSLFSYWTSNFVLDMMKHLVPAVFCILMVLAYNIDSFTGSESFGAVVLLFILYGWSIIPFSYFLGFLFEAYGNAQVASFFLHFLLGGIGAMIVLILRIIPSTSSAGEIVGWVLRTIPSFAFGYGIINVSSVGTFASLKGSKVIPSVYDFDIAGGDIMMMAIEGLVYYIFIFVYEKLRTIPSITQCLTRENNIQYIPKPLDEDVEKEIIKINNSNPKNYTVYVKDLRKVFIPDSNRIKVAVDKISFGIDNGECFTLLGVNGAGKTTTFKMISGEVIPTSGDSWINGYSVGSQLEQARQYIGYCPQFDALLENLTAKEHLELYAAIKGIPYSKREKLVQKKLIEMDLKQFENVCAGTYSGGNKRKLSVAIAMLGNPPIVFLDEPSTGMDPGARRFMWNVISRISTKRKQSSVILTTHSMEEAEALSTKVAIMVEGQLRCLGSVQHIKSKFGQGYEVEIKTLIPTHEMIFEFMKLHNLSDQQHIRNKTQLLQVLTNCECIQLQNDISDDGYGSALYMQMNQDKGLSIINLTQYIIIEKYGQLIMEYITQELGQYTLIEHFQNFFRFKIESKIAIGKLFRAFEQNKEKFNIMQYSVKQATIEQIFNQFALGKIGVNQQQKKSGNFEQDIKLFQDKNQQNEFNSMTQEMKQIQVQPNFSKKTMDDQF